MKISGSNRLNNLGSAIFTELAEWKEQVIKSGIDVIDLGIGSPDLPPSAKVIRKLHEAIDNPNDYGYPMSEGSLEFREAVAKWYHYRFNVVLDAKSEILTLMGSQDGLAHLAMAICNPGDIVLVPDPGYPIYSASLELAGVKPYLVPLREENDFLPQLEKIPDSILKQAKFMILNYPSNPLAAVTDLVFFEKWVNWSKKHEILAVHDLAYSEMAFDGFKPPSVLEVKGAKEIAVEFHSMSKAFNMAGCRIGYLVGHADVVSALKMIKSNIDYGVFIPIQKAAITALEEDMNHNQSVSLVYEKRRNRMIEGLSDIGWHIKKPRASMFIWAKIPHGWTSRQFSREMLFSQGLVVIPGDAFGNQGEGYVRLALVHDEKVLIEAVERMGRFFENHVL
ncbi:aminotransferase class I/II-fold pyridoxal phosphate-dependent enzyme [Chengkuizengella sediminis]|uniref:aminotransferase class I/II-fold pyridoxal phosphate-dependent enzyme n=1 Tax=Chengkuizengella sediminis TaxID=1885917 RepID=UPI00138A267E|nr:aminotransferase class I/II-fold pyridoxal phosphate-dependent enzyme [Chengkuizengella sediminis]NDI35826.1 aminotransferase class I/II-fold pyridoxal phosphate-dependent enzyme [Chengkuizengella sediminis]